ncbi:MAG: radical SAM protein [Chitinispirillales bacterium]|jgi:radical SAM protein with 4Fe4S-binding SPASM domain|nr:radical SAM protein [Chitinispirillales bacterium]
MKNRRFKKIYLEITNVCNKSCSFCLGTTREPVFLSIERFENRIKQIANLCEKIYLYVGGEPLLHPNIKEFLEIAQKLNVSIAITTNGILIEERFAALLSPALREFNVSVHSAQNSNEIEKIVGSALNLADKRSDLPISFRFWNYQNPQNFHFQKTIEILQAKFNGIKITPHTSNGRKKQKITQNLFVHFDSPFSWDKTAPVQKKGFCYGLQTHFAILADGRVVPCCLDKNGEIELGNIDEKNVTQILNSPRTKAIIGGFSQKIMVEKICQKCAFAQQKFSQKISNKSCL